MPKQRIILAKLNHPMNVFRRFRAKYGITDETFRVNNTVHVYHILFFLFCIWFWLGEVTSTVLPPVPTTGLTLDDVTTLSEEVRAKMIDVFVNQHENGHVVTGGDESKDWNSVLLKKTWRLK